MKMLENVKVIQNDGMLDVEALERYVVEALDGVIGQEYAEMKANITFTEGEIIVTPDDGEQDMEESEVPEENEVPKTGDNSFVISWMLVSAASVCVLVSSKATRRKRYQA